MRNEFTNRLGMFDTTLANLNKPENKAIWFNQPPQVFTTKVTDVTAAVADLRAFYSKQGTNITGAAIDKEREGREAIQAAHPLARALVTWFRDQADETNAAKVDLPESGWRRLRDQEQVEMGRMVRDLAQEVVNGPKAAQAVEYGITADAVAAADKEVEEYALVVSAPQASIAARKGLTQQLRDKFNAVELKFVALDDLVLSFSNGPASQSFIASHKAARIVRDLGSGPNLTPPTPAPTPTPPPQT